MGWKSQWPTSVVRNANGDDRVGIGGHVVAGVKRGELFLGQRVAVGVRAAVHPHQQDVDGPVLTTAAQRGGAQPEDSVLNDRILPPRPCRCPRRSSPRQARSGRASPDGRPSPRPIRGRLASAQATGARRPHSGSGNRRARLVYPCGRELSSPVPAARWAGFWRSKPPVGAGR